MYSGWVEFWFVSSPLRGLKLFISVLSVPHRTWPCEVYPMNVHLVFSKDSRDPLCRFLEVSVFITPSSPELCPATSSHLYPEFWSLSYQFSKTTVFYLGSSSQLCHLEISSRNKAGAIVEFTFFISLFSQVVPSYLLSNVWKCGSYSFV